MFLLKSWNDAEKICTLIPHRITDDCNDNEYRLRDSQHLM